MSVHYGKGSVHPSEARELRDGATGARIVQVTETAGVGGYSGILSGDGGTLYYTAAGAVRAVDLRTLEDRVLASWEGGQLGECSLSADGQRIVTAMKRKGVSYLTITETDGSGGEVIFECPRTIIHKEFRGGDCRVYATEEAALLSLFFVLDTRQISKS